jgi:diaminohydroxyphosphoribosylaminopyrimidine deaminase/5-amino-6-(5-phosphoribosylamino)uracil reductase
VGHFSTHDDDVAWMRRALAEAEQGRGWVEPNPLVGAAVVRQGRLVGIGHHERFGEAHAEVIALARAGREAAGATLYVTLEPCCHFGKTPPCTDAILAAGIARVVVALRDPFGLVSGRGLGILQEAALQVEVGCAADLARAQNAPYLKRLCTHRPFVTAKWAMTLDGKSATASGQSRWISSEQSRRLVHQLRGKMDAIVIGLGTVRSDNPLLTARPPGPRCPLRVVLDSAARLPVSSQLVKTARESPVLVAVTDRADHARREQLRQLGCEVAAFPARDRVPIGQLLEELGRRNMTNVLVEGGGQVLGAFLDEGEVDAVEVFIAPLLEGGDHAHTPARGRGSALMSDAWRLNGVEVSQVDKDLYVRGYLDQPWRAQVGFGSAEAEPRSGVVT